MPRAGAADAQAKPPRCGPANGRASALVWLALGAAVTLPPEGAWAAGLEVPELGAWAAGRGGAAAAQPTGGLAMQFNPAGMAFGRGFELGLDGKVAWQYVAFAPQNRAFEVPGGGETRSLAVPYVGPTDATLVYRRPVAHGRGAWAAGLGAIGPSATGRAAYPADGAQRYDKISVDAFLAYATGAVALRWGPVALGGSLQLARGSIGLTQAVASPLKFPAYPDIVAKLDASLGWAVTGVVGVSAALGKRVALGVSWRPRFTLPGSGTLAITLPSPLSSLATVQGNQATLGLTFPHVVRVGALWRPWSRLLTEVNVVWEGWSALQSIQIEPQNITIKPIALAAAPLKRFALQKQWRDTVGVRMGAEMRFLSGRLTGRLGYLFEPSAIPSAYAGVDFPNFGDHALSLGGTLRIFGILLDVAAVQHIRPTMVITDGQILPISPPPLPVLGSGAPVTPINNGVIKNNTFVLAMGLRVPFSRLGTKL